MAENLLGIAGCGHCQCVLAWVPCALCQRQVSREIIHLHDSSIEVEAANLFPADEQFSIGFVQSESYVKIRRRYRTLSEASLVIW